MSGVRKTKTDVKNKAKVGKTVVKEKNHRRATKIKVDVKGKPAKKTFGQRFLKVGLVVLPLMLGVISASVTGSAMMSFYRLEQPPLAPPAWLFPIVWTILYLLMGTASYLIYKKEFEKRVDQKMQIAEIVVYFVQLFFNFMWTILFFRLEVRWVAFGWLVVMWMMILALIAICVKNCRAAAWCLVPYVLWCTFAMYLNITIAILN